MNEKAQKYISIKDAKGNNLKNIIEIGCRVSVGSAIRINWLF